MNEPRLRRGLPRRPGGEAWPEAEAVARFTVVVPRVRPAVGPTWPEPGAHHAPLRRGLPRRPDGQGWPPEGSLALFSVAEPAIREDGGIVDPGQGGPVGPNQVEVGEPSTVAQPTSPSAVSERVSRRRRWPWVLIGCGLGALAVAMLVAHWFVSTDVGQRFLAAYPGTTPLPAWVPQGVPGWLGWQHFLNAFFMVMLIRAALIVRSGRRPAAMWVRRRPRPDSQKIQIELWTHLSLDLLWILNGVVFVVLLVVTGQWARIVPLSWDIVPDAASAVLRYLSWQLPSEDGWVAYNAVQVLGYGFTTFIAAPLAALTGWRLSPLWPKRWARLSRVYSQEVAKLVHFPVMIYFVAFCVVHVSLVLVTGAVRNLNYMYASRDDSTWWGVAIATVSVAAMVAGWFAIRPGLMTRVGSSFGKIGRS